MENTTNTTNTSIERKILQTSACQGSYVLNQDDRFFEDNIYTVIDLVDKGFLKLSCVEGKEDIYHITQTGKEHLKVLMGHIPKHRIEDVDINLNVSCEDSCEESSIVSLEAILKKRLNILSSANKRGLEFDLSDEDVRLLLETTVCYYTGVTFNEGDDPLNAKTFERIDDTKGYVSSNVVAVTLRANRIKNVLLEQDNDLKITPTQFIRMANKLKECL